MMIAVCSFYISGKLLRLIRLNWEYINLKSVNYLAFVFFSYFLNVFETEFVPLFQSFPNIS